MYVTTQKTHKRKTAGQWIKRAATAKMRAGTVEIVTDDLPGCILLLSDDDNLIVTDESGIVAAIECGVRAIAKMRRLGDEAEQQMLAMQS